MVRSVTASNVIVLDYHECVGIVLAKLTRLEVNYGGSFNNSSNKTLFLFICMFLCAYRGSEGDCDEDIDCKDGLKCFERKKNDNKNGRPDEVPGCELGDDDRPDIDYCYDPNWEKDREEGEETEEAEGEAEFAVVGDEMKDEDTISVPDIKGFDVTKCGGLITKRAQECGGSRNTPEKCCPGYICEGKNSVRCIVDPEAPITASTTPAPIRRPTQSPTRRADKKPRTWNTLMPEYILREEIIKLEPIHIQRMIALERDAFKFTGAPSAAPSASPTYYPTIAPTRMRKDECKIEMYYEKKFCWHDDGSECLAGDCAGPCRGAPLVSPGCICSIQ